MRLKRLEMIGFKSFMEKTVLEFERPVTVIVGPNGCGKSNVVDAIRWVMGEQSPKQLRGTSMGDVIFNGSDREKPLSMASVELTFGAEDGGFAPPYHEFNEVSVCRRLYRDGSSEYLVNRVDARLRDITDFFAGTGIGKTHYSIVEQGRIAELITAKPEDRRAFIEEAAGVSRFKARKEAALRKLESSEGNLLRLADILQELDARLRSLDRQVTKARRYQTLSEDLRDKDLRLTATRYREMALTLVTLQTELDRLTQTTETCARDLDIRENELAEATLLHQERERALADLQERDYRLQNELNLLKSAVSYKKSEHIDRGRARTTLLEECEALSHRFTETETAYREWQSLESNYQNKTGTLQADFQTALERVQASKQIEEEARLRAEREKESLVTLRAELAAAHTRRNDLSDRLQRISLRHTHMLARLDELNNELRETRSLKSHDEQELATLTQTRLKLKGDREALENTLIAQKNVLAQEEQTITTLTLDVQKKRSRLESLELLEKNFEGYGAGVRAVMNGTVSLENKAISGTLAQVLETDSRYETALAAILGDKLEYLCCGELRDGESILTALKTDNKGRVGLAPKRVLNLSTPMQSFPSGDGVIGPLRTFVRAQADYASVADLLLNGVLLVKDLGIALSLYEAALHSHTALPVLVTEDGDVIDASGFLIGGAGNNSSETLLANRREQKELRDALIALERDLTASVERKRRTVSHIDAMTQDLTTLSSDDRREELRVLELTNHLTTFRESAARIDAQIAEFNRELDEITRERDADQLALDTLLSEYELAEHRLTQLETELQKGDRVWSEAREKLLIEQDALATLKAQIASADLETARFMEEGARLTRDLTELNRTLERKQADLDTTRTRLDELSGEISESEARLIIEEESLATTKAAMTHERTAYQSSQDALRERERVLGDLRKQQATTLDRVHQLSLEQNELTFKKAACETHVHEAYAIALSQWISDANPDPLTEEDALTYQQDVTELRNSIQRLGPVNMDAISEYDEVKTRNDFLTQQKLDLEKSIASLRQALAKIDETSKARIAEAYAAINASFQEQFPRLFRGGRAHLALTGDGDILESGIEVFAEPPGKKLQSIALLSGGEKALTALSLLFAIFRYRPSPFCILDEVDAPLDDQNVLRYNELIKSMAGRTQFILITHAKSTMEVGDMLYGVTMPEAGVSRIVSVNLDAEEPASSAA